MILSLTRPPDLADQPLDEAVARAKREGRIVLLDMTASWCEPCRTMDRVTWPAPEVERWIAEHAVALRIDVDADQELARRFAVRAMPTVIALRDGAELDRMSGLARPADLVAWLDGLRGGRTRIDALRATLAQDPLDVRAHWDLSTCLLERGDLAGATEELAWIWEHALEHEPAFRGVRFSYALERIGELAERSSAAWERFAALRDRAAASIERDDVAASTLEDWIALSRTLGGADAILAWAARAPDAVIAREDLAHVLDVHVVPVLLEAERWRDVCRIHADPIATLRRELARSLVEMPEEDPDVPPDLREQLPQIRAMMTRSACERLECVERALRLGGRPEDADRLLHEIAASPIAAAFAELRAGPPTE